MNQATRNDIEHLKELISFLRDEIKEGFLAIHQKQDKSNGKIEEAWKWINQNNNLVRQIPILQNKVNRLIIIVTILTILGSIIGSLTGKEISLLLTSFL